MRLEDLLKGVQYTCLQGSIDREVTQVVYDSRKVSEGCLFICIKGANFDGHDFASEVTEKGAGVLVVSKQVPEVKDKAVTVIRVEDTRFAMAFISSAYFGHPA